MKVISCVRDTVDFKTNNITQSTCAWSVTDPKWFPLSILEVVALELNISQTFTTPSLDHFYTQNKEKQVQFASEILYTAILPYYWR